MANDANIVTTYRGASSDVVISDGVTSIGEWTFSDCRDLTSINIPNSVTRIGAGAFSGCTALTSITVGVENQDYADEKGVLFNKTKTILIQYPTGKSGAYLIPNSVTSIGDFAFCHCNNLTSVVIPYLVTSIGYKAFCECSRLTSVDIPNSVTCIGYATFIYCIALTSVTVGWATPLLIDSNVFYKVNLSACTLHVPVGTKTLYEASAVWKDFGTIVEKGQVFNLAGQD